MKIRWRLNRENHEETEFVWYHDVLYGWYITQYNESEFWCHNNFSYWKWKEPKIRKTLEEAKRYSESEIRRCANVMIKRLKSELKKVEKVI